MKICDNLVKRLGTKLMRFVLIIYPREHHGNTHVAVLFLREAQVTYFT